MGTTLRRAPSARRGIINDAQLRVLRLGAAALTDAELVALVAGVHDDGTAQDLVSGGLKALVMEAPENLADDPRLGVAPAARLLAAAELARRLSLREDARPRLGTPQAIYEYVKHHFLGLRREELHVLCFNSRNVLLRHRRVAQGSVDQCHVDPREALGPAIACRATAIVLVHGHPSGDPEPSVTDVMLTRQLRDGARLFCVKVLDHLVLGDQGFVSMLQRGLLDDDRPLTQARLQSRKAVDSMDRE